MSDQPPLFEPVPPVEPVPPPRKHRLRKTKWTLFAFTTVALLLVGAFVFLTRFNRGQRLVVDYVLDQIRSSLAGELSVAEIRSGGLLNGATLIGIELTAAEDRRFLTADSAVVRYSFRNLLGERIRMGSVVVYGAEVEISRYPGEEDMNVNRLLAPPDSTRPGGSFEMDLGRLELVDALVEVLTPAENPDEVAPTVPNPAGEGRLRRLALEDLDYELADIAIRTQEEAILRGTMEAMTSDISIFEDPLLLRGAQGSVRAGQNGIFVDDALFSLPSSRMAGSIELSPRTERDGDWAFTADLTTRGPGQLADVQWADARIPDGTFEGSAVVTVGDNLDAVLDGMHVDLGASNITFDGHVIMDQEPEFDGLAVRLSPLALRRLEPWISQDLPLQGFLSGNVTLSGTMARLDTDGRLTLVPEGYGGAPTTAVFDGVVHAGSDPGVTRFRATLDPLNVQLLDLVQPDLLPPGSARAVVTATGRLSRGVDFTADMTHTPDGDMTSRVVAEGSLRRTGGDRWITDVEADLQPLSMRLVQRYVPNTRLVGSTTGTVSLVGPLDDLRIGADLALGGGQLLATARVDLNDLGSGYELDTTLRGVRLADVAPDLPDLSAWTGRLILEGRGLTPETLVANAQIVSGSSRIGGLMVDSVTASVRAAGGLLTVDTLEAQVGGILVAGSGSVGLIGSVEGSADFYFHTDSLGLLRPVFMGEGILTREDVSNPLQRSLAEAQGVDPDTLPSAADVAMDGSVDGHVHLEGSLASLDVDGDAVLRDVSYGTNHVDSATVTLTAQAFGSEAGTVNVDADAMGVVALDRSFEEFHAAVDLTGSLRRGTADIDLVRRPGETLTALADFELDSVGVGGRLLLREARAELDSLVYTATGPATLIWNSHAVEVQNLEIERLGQDPVHLTANGVLDRAGNSDLVLDLQGAHIEDLARLAQLDSLDVSGHLDMRLRVTGPAETPDIEADFDLVEPAYGDVVLDRVTGTIAYADLSATVDLEAFDEGRRIFRAEGNVPVNLALDPQGDRIVQTPMDIHVIADSMEAAVPLSYLGETLTNVEGTVSADFRIRGTINNPVPTGTLTLENAAWDMDAIGVRHEDINGTLTLQPDAMVQVDVTGRSAGDVTVTGEISLEPLLNPTFALDIHLDRFEGVARRDIEGTVSGDLTLTGTYTKPFVQGSLVVDEGALFLEEFQRAATVVDLSDPRLMDAVDFEALEGRPLLAGISNPFLEGLRADISLNVPGNVELRAQNMNVEIGGDLLVTYDRAERDVVLVGDLEALRGTYNVAGRNFDVEAGTVSFIGTSGINPILDIQAVSRIRREADEDLEVRANVTGNLADPRVQLSSDERGLSEADLVSYLVFGRPSYQLGNNQAAAIGAASNFLYGTLASQFGTYFAQQIGLDYLEVNFGQSDLNPFGTLANARIEVGEYIGEDFFVVFVLKPPTALDSGSGGLGPLSGVRVEWKMTEKYTLEAFVEERFLRSGAGVFRDLNIEASQVVGVFVFREFGY